MHYKKSICYYFQIVSAGATNYRWKIIVISKDDTRSILQPLLTESTRVALLLFNKEDNDQTNEQWSDKKLCKMYSLLWDTSGRLHFKEVKLKNETDL